MAIGAAMDSGAVLPIDVWVRRWSSTKDLCAVLKAQGTDGVFPCEDVMLLLSVVHKQRACFFDASNWHRRSDQGRGLRKTMRYSNAWMTIIA